MSPEALEVAIVALEAELDTAGDWLKAAEANVVSAEELLAQGHVNREDAEARVERLREALDALRAMQTPAESVDEPQDEQ